MLILRTSDRAAHRRCKRKWYFESPLARNLTPIQPNRHLFLGSGVHYALSECYKRHPHGYDILVDVFTTWCADEIRKYEEATGEELWPDELAAIRKFVDLGAGM